jgi:hypothetical protein
VTLSALTLGGTDAGQFERLTGQAGDCTATTTLTAGETCDVRVRFDPATVGAKAATLTVASNATEITVALTGTGTQTELTRSPASLPFGNRDIDDGPSSQQPSTVTNSGSEPVTLSALTLGGADPSQFERLTGQAGDCTATTTLTAGQTCDVRVRFDPAAVGAKAATLTVASNAADITVALTGTGTQTELTRSPTFLAFGSRDIDDGPTTSQTSTVTNSGSEPVTLTGLTLGGGDPGQFERLTGEAGDCNATTTLTAGQTCEVRVRFDPTSTGAKTGTLTLASNAADITIALTGTGTQTELTNPPVTLAFGNRDIDDGPTTSQASTVTNSGSEPVTLSTLALGGTDPGQFERLTGQAGDCTATTTLTAGQTCDVRVRFDPFTTAAKTATLTIASNAADITISLTGTGTQSELTRTPASLAFGSRDVDQGPTAGQSSTITNTGSEPVTLNTLTLGGTDPGQFERLTGQTGDCTTTTTLTAGQTCDLRLRFDPSSIAAKTATLIITSSAAPISVALTGTGTHVPDSQDASPLESGRQSQPPAPSPRPAALPRWTLQLGPNAPKVSRRRAGVYVATGYSAGCPPSGPDCTGRLTLKVLRRTGSGRVRSFFLTPKAKLITIPAGSRRPVTLRLSRLGTRRLAQLRTTTVVLRGSVRIGTHPAIARTATLKTTTPPRQR